MKRFFCTAGVGVLGLGFIMVFICIATAGIQNHDLAIMMSVVMGMLGGVPLALVMIAMWEHLSDE